MVTKQLNSVNVPAILIIVKSFCCDTSCCISWLDDAICLIIIERLCVCLDWHYIKCT